RRPRADREDIAFGASGNRHAGRILRHGLVLLREQRAGQHGDRDGRDDARPYGELHAINVAPFCFSASRSWRLTTDAPRHRSLWHGEDPIPRRGHSQMTAAQLLLSCAVLGLALASAPSVSAQTSPAGD